MLICLVANDTCVTVKSISPKTCYENTTGRFPCKSIHRPTVDFR